ncbi:MAG: ATP-dependent DNA helicase RecG [Candidatus Wildermuthbacteria bacterium]|nr:ATP-dependent DNA helicase RecG [Candidatus Wildermuthbacteria bacterium]
MDFSTPLSQVPRIGPVYQKRLSKLGMATVRDLLFRFPRSYEDFSRIAPIQEIKEGQTFCIAGTILDITEERTFRKRMSLTHAVLEDQTGAVRILWFNQPYLATTLQKGMQVCLAGSVMRDKQGIYISNPSYQKVEGQFSPYQLTHVGRIVPVYEESQGISSRWFRSIVKSVLATLSNFPETLPEYVLKERKFPALKESLWHMHFPDSLESSRLTRKRFAFEELFFIMLFILSERKKLSKVKAPPILLNTSFMKRFTSLLPFKLTNAQKKASWHILKDMENPRPMNRLLEGDVGSGKTVVAAMAALSCAKAGYQAVFMAPTEILAQQHFKSIGQLLAPFKLTIGLLTGSQDRFISPKLPHDSIEISRTKLVEKAKKNEVQVFIGTHALIQDKVKFANLGLVVLDEQHRFGVRQRAKLLHKATLIPHLLSMTATPIPRTLAMSIYGDLDLSVIDEMPKERKRVITQLVPPSLRKETYQFIQKEVEKGRQAFVICPRIQAQEPEQDSKLELKTVEEEYEKLSKSIFPKFSVAMLHGKMGTQEKEQIMKKFRRGKIDVLVSTSVVEVGVDIPNATCMMIESAERFGLAQLHQFRGRVGRGAHQSYCFLFTESNAVKTRKRLKAIQDSKTGFVLAEMDLKLRGPGDFLGNKQWGIPDFAMEQLADPGIVQEARQAALAVLEKDISLAKHPSLKAKVEDLRTKLHLE